jgi:predicted nucleic acid-binding protein
VEVLSVLRRYSIRRELSELRAAEALAALGELRTLTYPVIELASAIWELRARLTAYEAAYLTLAQQLDVPLITLDGGLAEAAANDGRLATLR